MWTNRSWTNGVCGLIDSRPTLLHPLRLLKNDTINESLGMTEVVQWLTPMGGKSILKYNVFFLENFI
jgi:hypothetical protein